MADRAEVRAPVPSQSRGTEAPADESPGPPPPPDPPARPRSRWRAEPWRFLEVFALCGFVVVQPLLEVIGGSPDFFIFHGVTGFEVAVLVAIFTLVPPVVLWGIGALAGFAGRRVRRAVHVATIALLFVQFMVELGKNLTPIRGVLLVALAVVVTAVIIFGYLRLDVAKQLLRFAAVGPLVFVLLFVFASPSSAVVLAGDRPSNGGAAQITGENPPIVMILLDEFAMASLLGEDGTVDAERFPNFARLAGGSTWYRNATAVAGWTPYAVPSMLSGRWPSEHRAPHYAIYPDNLFTLLGDIYQISASESITHLCPPWYCGDRAAQSRGGLSRALAESYELFTEIGSPVDPVSDPYDDYAEPTLQELLGEAATADQAAPSFRFGEALGANQPVRYQDFLAGLAPGAQAETSPNADDLPANAPELHFLHLLLPHTPWTYLADGLRYENVSGMEVEGEWWGELARQRYQQQLQYTDALLGETLDALEETGQYDESLMVLTADHGVSLTPGGPGCEETSTCAGSREIPPDAPGILELGWVPLFIKEPGQTEGVIEDGNWQHVDLLPTIADYAGVEVPWEVDGISWKSDERTDPEKTFYPHLDQSGTIDPEGFAKIMADPTGLPAVPPAPLPELVGTRVAEYEVLPSTTPVEVENADAFRDVDLAGGMVPALVHGTVSGEAPEGTPLAIAVNGEIGAVVPVTGEGQFAGLVTDPDLWRSGENQLELFLVPDGVTLHALG